MDTEHVRAAIQLEDDIATAIHRYEATVGDRIVTQIEIDRFPEDRRFEIAARFEPADSTPGAPHAQRSQDGDPEQGRAQRFTTTTNPEVG